MVGMKKEDSWNWEDNAEPKVPSPRSRRNTHQHDQQRVQQKRQCLDSPERASKSDYFIGDGSCSSGNNSVSGSQENLNTFGVSSRVTSEHVILDRPPRPPGIRKTSSNSPIYIEAGGVLIPESKYERVTLACPSSSSSSMYMRNSSSELVDNMINNEEDAKKSGYLSKNITLNTLKYTDSFDSLDEKTKDEKLFKAFNEREDKSTKPGQGLVESFLNSLNPLDWIEWHYEYCNAPARRQHIISSTKKEVSNIIISADQSSLLPCVVSPADGY